MKRLLLAALLALAVPSLAETPHEIPVEQSGVPGALIAIHAHRFDMTQNQGVLVVTADALIFNPDKSGQRADHLPLLSIVTVSVNARQPDTAQITVVTDSQVVDYRIPEELAGRVLRLLAD